MQRKFHTVFSRMVLKINYTKKSLEQLKKSLKQVHKHIFLDVCNKTTINSCSLKSTTLPIVRRNDSNDSICTYEHTLPILKFLSNFNKNYSHF